MRQGSAWLMAASVAVLACGGRAAAPKPPATVAAKAAAPDAEKRVAPADDPAVIAAQGDYQAGLAAIDDGRAADAVEPLERALAAFDGVVADDDARLRDTLHLLVQAYRGAERYHDAEVTARRMLELVRRTGPRTSEITALNQLGLGFYESGDVAEASRAWAAAAALHDELGVGMSDPDARVIRRNLALAYGDLDRHEDAMVELRRVHTELEVLDPTSLEAANTMYMLAKEYETFPELRSTALDLFTRAVDIYLVELEPGAERLMEALEWKGSLLWTSRDLAGARTAFQQILKLRMRDGQRDREVALAYADLGVIETELEDSAVAIIHLDQAIEILREDAAPDVDQIITLLAWRARARVQHDDLAEADRDADEAIRMAIDLWGASSPEILELVDSLASGYTDFKQAKRGKAFRARAKKLIKGR